VVPLKDKEEIGETVTLPVRGTRSPKSAYFERPGW
jgi:hypothetical protein